MLKFRNIIILLVAQYVLLLFISGFYELRSISKKSEEILTMIRTAADMALEQSQLVDEFMSYGGRESYTLLMPALDGSGFKEVDMIEGIFNKNSKDESLKREIFEEIYATNEFMMLADRLGAMRRPVRYFTNPSNPTTLDWYYIPRVSLMGTNILPSTRSVLGVKDKWGNYISDSHAAALYRDYRLEDYMKESGGREYYNTPISLGITYLNTKLLGTLFMNNMDLLMRQKYVPDFNLNTYEGGNGVLKGVTFSSKIKGDLSMYYPIHNGSFTILRHNRNTTNAGVYSFTGIEPLVVYKVIDMYDPANDELLQRLFGANKGSYPTKAEYLKSLDERVINPVTSRPYESKPIVVAKVTFYVDVIVPYSSLVFREMRATFGTEEFNLIDIKDPDGSVIPGAKRISYTCYFAVTP